MKTTQTLSTFLFAGLSAASPMFGSGTGTDDLGSLIPTGSGTDSLGGLSSLIPTGSGSDSLGGLGSLIPTGSGSDSLGGLGSLVPTGTGSDSLGGLGSLIPTGSSSDSLGGLGGLGALSSLIPSAATETGSADSSGSSLTAKAASGCTAYTLLFARGTTETGTLGTVVGPGLQKSVQSALGADQVTVKVCGIHQPPPLHTYTDTPENTGYHLCRRHGRNHRGGNRLGPWIQGHDGRRH